MPSILLIESSTTVCSVALSNDGVVLAVRENSNSMLHATYLAPFCEEILAFVRVNRIDLDAVAVCCGPGSYTGLRIGVSLAKGICYGLNLPLISVNTLELLAASLPKKENVLLCPMIDARRMEVYTAIYDSSLNLLKPISADIITEDSYGEYLERSKLLFFGDGAGKCRSVITHPNAEFIPDIMPFAKKMVGIAELKFANSNFEDLAYFEPFYLKEFVATVSKNKVF